MKKSLYWLVSVLAVFSLMPVSHAIVVYLKTQPSGTLWIAASLSIGLLGAVLIRLADERDEVTASVFGFIAGHCLFIGFFELCFGLGAKALQLQALTSPQSGRVLLSPSLQLVELSGLLLLPMLLIHALDASVRCNMFTWIRAKTGLLLAQSTVTKRQYGKIAASETVFVIWTLYVISLVCLDPRVLGPSHWLSYAIYAGLIVWPLYLLARIRRIRHAGHVFRYAIPVGVLFWSWVEMLSSMDLIDEYFMHPRDYPVATLGTVLLAGLLLIAVPMLRSRDPAHVDTDSASTRDTA